MSIPEHGNLEVRNLIREELSSCRVGAQVCMDPFFMDCFRSEDELRENVKHRISDLLSRDAVHRMTGRAMSVSPEADQTIYRVHGYFLTGDDLYRALARAYDLGATRRPDFAP